MKMLRYEDILHKLPKRQANSHKGDYGRVLLIGGNANMGGAIMMAAKAAVHSGAGLTTVATDASNHTALHCHLPEAMVIDWENTELLLEKLHQSDVVLIGCGLGLSEQATTLLSLVLSHLQPSQKLIIDGDAITLFAKYSQNHYEFPIWTTPHQKEGERLSGLAIDAQTPANNLHAVSQLQLNVILKKHGTTLYLLNHEPLCIDVGTPAMATGGMGDTLAGMITGLLAQYPKQSEQAVCTAVYLHSYIAEQLAKTRHVVLPTEIIGEISSYLKLVI